MSSFRSRVQKREIGKVIEHYDFENEYRYVVKFEDGREDAFFEKELLSAEQRSKSSSQSPF